MISAVAIRSIDGEIVDRDAIEIGALYERSNSSLADAVRARLECGARLIEKKAPMARGQWLPWLQSNAGVLGFDTPRTAQMLIKGARDNAKPASHLPTLGHNEAVAISRKLWGHSQGDGNHRAQGTGENEWYTPDEHIAAARMVLDGIDLDPASSVIANRAVQAEQFFSEADDGLEKPWFGKVWLNPPYAQPAIAQFADKMVSEWKAGNVEAAIVLTHNYTDTAWFHTLAKAAAAICFTRGRIRFVSPSGELAAPTQGQAFFYFGSDSDIFADVFGEIGFIATIERGSV